MTKKYYLIFFLCLIVACDGLSGMTTKQRTSAEEALKALKKIQASTEVGVNIQTYNQLLVDAKDKVNEAESTLPDGELKQELKKSFDNYNEAYSDWRAFISLDSNPEGLDKYWSEAETHNDKASKLLN